MGERAACRLVGQARSTQWRELAVPDDELVLVKDMRRLSMAHPWYGYRRIHRLLVNEGWPVNHKSIQRLWATRQPSLTSSSCDAAVEIPAGTGTWSPKTTTEAARAAGRLARARRTRVADGVEWDEADDD
ncbi:IS3 family transposase [Engelhardtia mirabilis]|uniref:HTH-like domain-containing protein n=1 Tax=Engelhardtia mirabilis TaxID=2528011 RepID=A0A518BHT3_9BACT|nr:hypothetical protein Pla133_16150 [Planctomycetes bacterium Pla133]QDV00865.1 hypothetical protein Pla86_16140 [Planctomycetes bacterium Pla86]